MLLDDFGDSFEGDDSLQIPRLGLENFVMLKSRHRFGAWRLVLQMIFFSFWTTGKSVFWFKIRICTVFSLRHFSLLAPRLGLEILVKMLQSRRRFGDRRLVSQMILESKVMSSMINVLIFIPFWTSGESFLTQIRNLPCFFTKTFFSFDNKTLVPVKEKSKQNISDGRVT